MQHTQHAAQVSVKAHPDARSHRMAVAAGTRRTHVFAPASRTGSLSSPASSPLSIATEMTGAEIHAHMAAELIDAKLTPFAARIFLAGLAALAVALGWRFQARRFDVLDWRVVSFAIVVADALMLKSAHLVLPFTLAAFAWVLGIALGAQTRDALAWFALHPRGSLASSAGRSRANPQDRHRCGARAPIDLRCADFC